MFSALILAATMSAPGDLGYVIVDRPPVFVQERLPVVVVPRPQHSIVVARHPYVQPPIVVQGPVTFRPVMPLRRSGRWLLGLPQPPSIIVR